MPILALISVVVGHDHKGPLFIVSAYDLHGGYTLPEKNDLKQSDLRHDLMESGQGIIGKGSFNLFDGFT